MRTRPEILDAVVSVVSDITRDWNLDVEIKPESRLIGELGFTSMDIIDLMAGLDMRLHRKLPYESLMVLDDGGYRQELLVSELADFLEQNFDVERAGPVSA
jgi:acyl carrier protein